uniref:Uncharacterized protein n=1 Tax=Heterorhabditis bacteriophora TaxID=37862 RepID=A0A1I7WF25_HETBA
MGVHKAVEAKHRLESELAPRLASGRVRCLYDNLTNPENYCFIISCHLRLVSCYGNVVIKLVVVNSVELSVHVLRWFKRVVILLKCAYFFRCTPNLINGYLIFTSFAHISTTI